LSIDGDEQAASPAELAAGRDARATERRHWPARFHLPERRTGFDRRRRYPMTGSLRDNPLALLGVLVLVNTLSALDFAFTWLQLQAGVAEEGNPVLAGMFAEAPAKAWFFKSGVMLVVSLVIWHQRKRRAMLSVALVALALYIAVLVYHLVGMSMTGLI